MKSTQVAEVYDLYSLKWKNVARLVTVYDDEDVHYSYCELKMKPSDIKQSIGGVKCLEVNDILIKELVTLGVKMISINMKDAAIIYAIPVATVLDSGVDVVRKANTFKSVPIKCFASKRVVLTEAFIQEQMCL